MQTTELCRLWCLVEGEANPFDVVADVAEDIHQLKKHIQGEKPALRVVEASDIVLRKVSMF